MSQTIYKIAPEALWREAEKNGRFTGAPIDIADGFIHFSTAGQARETAAKHFAGQTDLVLVAVDGARLGDALKYEVSRGGALFPHLYGRPLVPGDIAADIALDPQAVIAMSDADLAALFPRPATAAHRPL